jgi:hypothetical protein
MERMDQLKPEIVRLFAAKLRRRARLARLSFSEKDQAVIQMQRMAASILRARGKKIRVWEMQPSDK